jgi:exopolysaccharide biosynthesis polyprenyl glycosylphosphotransferase
MLRGHTTALHLSLMAADAGTAIALFAVVSMVRFGPEWHAYWSSLGADPLGLAVLFGLVWTGTLSSLDLYRMRARLSWRREWVDIGRAVLLLAIATFSVLFIVKAPDVSRLFLISYFGSLVMVAIVSRRLVRWLYARARSNGYNASFVLVVGDGPEGRAFAERVNRHAAFGLRLVGFVATPAADAPTPGTSLADPAHQAGTRARNRAGTLGEIDDLPQILHQMVVDEVAICLPSRAAFFVEPVARLCEEEGRIVRIPLGAGGLVLPGGSIEVFDGIPVQSLVYGPDRAVALIAKRVLDVFGALLGLVVLSPILLAVVAYIGLRDGRPIFFRQVRVGLHGRPFRIFKFRTMVKDAEERYAEVASMSDTAGAAFKMTDDPRITQWGRVLRRTSIDELPQLLNVLRGEMSLVGPRPAPPREVEGYDVWHRRRLSIKPGVTGLWQVEARLDEDFDRRASLDLQYIDRWSLSLDLKIILKTIPAMLQGR